MREKKTAAAPEPPESGSAETPVPGDRSDGALRSRGAAVEVRRYSDEEIAAWDAADRLAAPERARILEAVALRKRSSSRPAARR